MVKHICKQCNHEWNSLLDNPKSCPRCKRYDWNNPTLSGASIINANKIKKEEGIKK